MPPKDKIAVKMNRKVEVLERHKAMIDALIRFVKKHPKTTYKAAVKLRTRCPSESKMSTCLTVEVRNRNLV
jgi:hypothetical protein